LRQWPADKVQRWSLSKIKPYERNARTHSDAQINQIAASMRKYGVTAPLLVDENGVLIYGHGRLAAAIKLGFDEMPVCVAHNWSEEDKAAYRIADNQIALNSDWDTRLLTGEIEELTLVDYDLPLLGFSDVQLQQIIGITPSAAALNAAAQLEGLKFAVIVECTSEADQTAKLEKFMQMGFSCRALIS